MEMAIDAFVRVGHSQAAYWEVCPGWQQPRAELNSAAQTNATAITHGTLWSYNDNANIYHCPADTSLDTSWKVLRDRSYSMSCGMNWTNIDSAVAGVDCNLIPANGSFYHLSDIMNPGPSLASVFIDVSANSIDNNEFPCWNAGDATYQYYKLPTSRHGSSCGNGTGAGILSFADGHSEIWRWKSPFIAQGNAIPDQTLGGSQGSGWQAQSGDATDQDLPRLQQTFPHIANF